LPLIRNPYYKSYRSLGLNPNALQINDYKSTESKRNSSTLVILTQRRITIGGSNTNKCQTGLRKHSKEELCKEHLLLLSQRKNHAHFHPQHFSFHPLKRPNSLPSFLCNLTGWALAGRSRGIGTGISMAHSLCCCCSSFCLFFSFRCCSYSYQGISYSPSGPELGPLAVWSGLMGILKP
jgi:hypothetical protein